MTRRLLQCVVDASVATKLFLEEPGSEEAQALFERILADPAGKLLVPDLFFAECASTMWKRVRREAYPEEAARSHLAALKSLPLVSTPTRDLATRAFEIACAHGITAYDACYVALSEAAGVPLLTADGQLAAALARAPFEVAVLGGSGPSR